MPNAMPALSITLSPVAAVAIVIVTASTTLTIAKREFRSNFDSPLAYIVICIGLVMLGIFFFFVQDFFQLDRATLVELFQLAPRGLSLVIVPVVTMRLLAEAYRTGMPA